MRFGIGLWCLQSTALSPRHHVRAYRELREDARLAEALGFESIWLSEHHFFYDGYCPALLPAAAGALAVTTRLRVGTGMLLLPLQDPERVRRQAADLAWRSGGRLDLGVALGYRDIEFDGKGVPRKERLARELKGLDLLEPAEANGFTLWMGGAVIATAARAGGRGHPILLSGALPVRLVADLVNAHRKGWEQQGLGRAAKPRVAALRNIWVTEDAREREAVLDWVRASYILYAGLGWAVAAEGEHKAMDFAHQTDQAVKAAVATTIIGPPARVIAELRELERIGVDTVVCRIMLEGAPRPAIHTVMHRLSAEVFPALGSPVAA